MRKDRGKHYRYSYRGIKLDPARIAKIYGIVQPLQAGILKKVLRAGSAHKTLQEDILDVICGCERLLEMIDEDSKFKVNKKIEHNLFLIGAAKCGTTSLHSWLAETDDVCMSSVKEPNYFYQRYHRTQEWYENKYFQHYAGEKIAGQSAVMNGYIDYVANRIEETSTNPKFIICIRNPVDRFYSGWRNRCLMRHGRESENFSKVLDGNIETFMLNPFELEKDYVPYADAMGGTYHVTLLEQGMYYTIAKRYIGKFGGKNVKIVLMDDMKNDPEKLYADVCKFIDVNPSENVDFSPKNVKLGVMTNETNWRSEYKEEVRILEGLYSDEVRCMSNLIGIDLNKKWGI